MNEYVMTSDCSIGLGLWCLMPLSTIFQSKYFCIQVIGVDFVNKYVINGPFSYFEFSKTATCLNGQNNLLAQEYL